MELTIYLVLTVRQENPFLFKCLYQDDKLQLENCHQNKAKVYQCSDQVVVEKGM